MTAENTDSMGTAFTVSVDSAEATTGISAAERALTIKQLADPATAPEDLRRPGHIFPLQAREGGVLKRARSYRGGGGFDKIGGAPPGRRDL